MDFKIYFDRNCSCGSPKKCVLFVVSTVSLSTVLRNGCNAAAKEMFKIMPAGSSKMLKCVDTAACKTRFGY